MSEASLTHLHSLQLDPKFNAFLNFEKLTRGMKDFTDQTRLCIFVKRVF